MEMLPIVSCILCRWKSKYSHTSVLVVCLSPGNLKMGPGVRVSQLMNIGFDMAAWVRWHENPSGFV